MTGRDLKRMTGLLLVFFLLMGTVVPGDCPAGENDPVRVSMETSLGAIVVELNTSRAPVTVDNFLQYVDDGFYDGTIFHRVIRGFVIQGGGFDENMNQKTTRAPIINEADNGLSNRAYTIAMARTLDPHSATSQFFINLVDNTSLDKSAGSDGYAVFGEVVDGKDVVDAIGAVGTTTIGGFQDVPIEPVIITSVNRSVAETPGDDDKNGANDSDSACLLGIIRGPGL